MARIARCGLAFPLACVAHNIFGETPGEKAYERRDLSSHEGGGLARIFHESLAATTDMAILPGVLGCRPLRRTVQVRLGTNALRLPGGKPIFVVSRQQFIKYLGRLYLLPF